MTYSTLQLENISKYAESLMKLSHIAALLRIDEDELRLDLANKTSEVSIVYREATAKTILAIQESEVKLAKTGSPLALQIVSNYITDLDDDINF